VALPAAATEPGAGAAAAADDAAGTVFARALWWGCGGARLLVADPDARACTLCFLD
jgi:hypothetical protein